MKKKCAQNGNNWTARWSFNDRYVTTIFRRQLSRSHFLSPRHPVLSFFLYNLIFLPGLVLFLRHIIYKKKANFYFPMELFLPDVCQLRSRHIASLFTFRKVKVFIHQNVANLPYKGTETDRFLKTFKLLVFYEEINGFFEKKLNFFSNSLKLANLLLNAS